MICANELQVLYVFAVGLATGICLSFIAIRPFK